MESGLPSQRVRRLIKDKTDELLRQYDFLVLPTTPTTAFNIDEKQDPVSMYLADIFTVQASLAGVPAISIPVGEDAAGLPIGLQVMAGAFREAELLAFASVLTELGLPKDALVLSLLGFNLGVEIGQLAIVAVFLPVAYLMRNSVLYRKGLFMGGSFLTMLVALVWLAERALNLKLIST